MNILHSAQKRYATKAFDPSKTLDQTQIDALKSILHLSPSSINLQPWHFIVAISDDAKAKIAKACPDALVYNAEKIKDAAMVVVFCAKTSVSQADVERVIDQEHEDGRFPNEDAKHARKQVLSGYVERLNEDPNRAKAWIDKQTYIALGNVLLAAADMDIDSVPIEGFLPDVVDAEFDLLAKGYHSTVLAAFGYRSDNDFNADLPKSRLPEETLFTEC